MTEWKWQTVLTVNQNRQEKYLWSYDCMALQHLVIIIMSEAEAAAVVLVGLLVVPTVSKFY